MAQKKVPTKEQALQKKKQNSFSLTDAEARQLAEWGLLIEKHYKTPMDIEWAKDGNDGKLYIVQARPETVHAQKNPAVITSYTLKEKARPLVTGISIGSGVGFGKVRRISSIDELHTFKEGEVLAAPMTDPDWEPVMKKAAAIITECGGRTCHAAIVSRELGIPCIVGSGEKTKKLKTGQTVTVDCSQGEIGYIYPKKVDYKKTSVDTSKLTLPKKPKLMLNVGDPDQAFRFAQYPNQGVGLARLEFIITSFIKVHPNALIEFSLQDKTVQDAIEEAARGWEDKKEFYIDQLSYGIAKIAAAFYPHKVIVRFSDFKTNEYDNLIGGNAYEPDEENPMLGLRGASRYYDDSFKQAFELEVSAMKKVYREYGLTNLAVMVPFCRTIGEADTVSKLLNSYGLKGKNAPQRYMMVEIPSNVILLEKFARFFDGFSIGSNDLTQLTLGLDRDNELLQGIGDERDPAVQKLISHAIQKAKRMKKPIGICGQAPSDFPDVAHFLAREGITSISVTPDAVVSVLRALKK